MGQLVFYNSSEYLPHFLALCNFDVKSDMSQNMASNCNAHVRRNLQHAVVPPAWMLDLRSRKYLPSQHDRCRQPIVGLVSSSMLMTKV
jgi:hypothetical protein